MSAATTTDAPERTVFRTCPLCEATCGLEITLKGDKVSKIRGDQKDVFSGGFICPKGTTLGALHEDPDRLRAPLVKRDGKHVEVSWDEAFDVVRKGVAAIREEFGNEAFGAYLGNPNVHNLGGALFVRPVLQALRTKSIFSASTVDQMPRHISCGLMYGGPDSIPVPDLDRTDYLLMLGANPLESNGSLCTAPDFPGRLKKLRDRGGKFVVIDPRTTRTAKLANQHLTIRPGTDAHFLLAIANVLFAEDLADIGALAEFADGYDAVRDAVAPFEPAAVAAVTGIDEDEIRTIAREIAAAKSATVYGRIGVHTAEFGTLASWAADIVCIITGNFDRPGGLMFPLAAHMRPRREGPGRGFTQGRWNSRVRNAPEVRGELPVATLAEEIQTEGKGQVRALLTVAGNPALSAPNADRLAEAFAQLAFMVSVDPYLNETTRHADVILPPPSVLQRSHYDLAFTTLSVRNVANYSPAVLPSDGPSEADILARLALAITGGEAGDDPNTLHQMLVRGLIDREVGNKHSAISGRDPDEIAAAVAEREPAEALLDIMLRTGPYGDGFGKVDDGLTLQTLEDAPHGVDLGALEPALPDGLTTASGKLELFPTEIENDLVRLRAALTNVAAPDSICLIGRRTVRSNNSWMHNVKSLMRGRDRCTLQINPTDAERLGLTDGALSLVTSRVGSVSVPVEVTDEICVGVVSLPHGYGHDQAGSSLGIAAKTPGVNSNRLTDDLPLDPLSGNAILNGIPVTVKAA
ncbi:MAG: anaerobic selenocysteine-containing dehydrogenase [Myxococcota bacterium]|jgi:anaerobic selenocysteine-containing dehydrogenase